MSGDSKYSDKALFFTNKAGKRFPLQSCSDLDELIKYSNPIEKKFSEFGDKLAKLIGAKFELGPTKERDVAEKKIKRSCLNKATLISDIVRAKLVADSSEGIAKLAELLDPENAEVHHLLKEFGAYSVKTNNHFARPKKNTGYRCLNAKISFPFKLKKGEIEELIMSRTSDTEKEIPTWEYAKDLPVDVDDSEYDDAEYIVELQIVHKDIEHLYHRTHYHMRQAQEIYGKYKNVQVPNEQARRAAAHYAVCIILHSMAAQKAGLDDILENENDKLTPIKERMYRALCGKYRLSLNIE